MPPKSGTTKIGRNDPCPCGSGKKYKRCCLHASDDRGFFNEAKALQRAMSVDRCSAPPGHPQKCSSTFAKAHTVPRASLKRIAANGHIFSFVPNATNLERHGPKFPPQRWGINRASTFTGFCSNHDDAIFAPLEKTPFAGTPEQCFLLAYRALARELHLKQSILAYWDDRLRKQTTVEIVPPLALLTLQGFLDGTRKGVVDLASHKSAYDRILLTGDYRDVRAHVIELSGPPTVMCSSGIVPEHTFDGEKLIDIPSHRQRLSLLSFSSFADATAGFVVFAWVEDGTDYCSRLSRSLKRLPAETLTASLVRFFFECSENIHLQPSWWQGLSASVQDRLVARMDGSSEFIPRDQARDFHSDDGVAYGRWHVVQRYDVAAPIT
ncbi:MAG: hypothetical protein F4Y02_07905 [Chloroflexi bacterium]|nr:hypothetical protein [Chloroflexota bacterium]